MNVKRIAALATLGALISTATPAFAASSDSVVVKWNTQKSAAIALYTQTTASQASAAPAANDIYWASDPAGSTTSQCNNAGNGVAAAGKDGGGGNGSWTAKVVNFGDVTPDGVDYTDCLEINAIEAYITTNDASGALTNVTASAAPVGYGVAGAGGSYLCIIKDGTWNAGSATAWTASGLSAAVAINTTNACPGGDIAAATGAGSTLLNSTAAVTSDLNSDLELVLGPNSTVGSAAVTLTYTVTPN